MKFIELLRRLNVLHDAGMISHNEFQRLEHLLHGCKTVSDYAWFELCELNRHEINALKTRLERCEPSPWMSLSGRGRRPNTVTTYDTIQSAAVTPGYIDVALDFGDPGLFCAIDDEIQKDVLTVKARLERCVNAPEGGAP